MTAHSKNDQNKHTCGGGGMGDAAGARGTGAIGALLEAAAGICGCCCWADCGKITARKMKADC